MTAGGKVCHQSSSTYREFLSKQQNIILKFCGFLFCSSKIYDLSSVCKNSEIDFQRAILICIFYSGMLVSLFCHSGPSLAKSDITFSVETAPIIFWSH